MTNRRGDMVGARHGDEIDRIGQVHGATQEQCDDAAKVVRRLARDDDDAAKLLAMLGLIGDAT